MDGGGTRIPKAAKGAASALAARTRPAAGTRKTPIPKDAKGAAEALARIGTLRREVEADRAALDERIATLRVALQGKADAKLAEIAALEAGLRHWATVNRDELTKGGRTKTVKLASGELSWRQGPSRLLVEDEKAAVAVLSKWGMTQFLRTSVGLDKAALLKEPGTAVTLPGVKVEEGREEFVAKPLPGAGGAA